MKKLALYITTLLLLPIVITTAPAKNRKKISKQTSIKSLQEIEKNIDINNKDVALTIKNWNQADQRAFLRYLAGQLPKNTQHNKNAPAHKQPKKHIKKHTQHRQHQETIEIKTSSSGGELAQQQKYLAMKHNHAEKNNAHTINKSLKLEPTQLPTESISSQEIYDDLDIFKDDCSELSFHGSINSSKYSEFDVAFDNFYDHAANNSQD